MSLHFLLLLWPLLPIPQSHLSEEHYHPLSLSLSFFAEKKRKGKSIEGDKALSPCIQRLYILLALTSNIHRIHRQAYLQHFEADTYLDFMAFDVV